MTVLVDYDNIDSRILRRGISYVIDRIFAKIDPSEVTGRNILVRLYGGWYEGSRFTTRAQSLAIDISANFPNTALLSDNRTSVIVNCTMAYSILADPSHHLFHTYRVRGIPSGLHARNPRSLGCSTTNCPVMETYNFISNNSCRVCSSKKPEDILYRSEQKLVDTMLTSDLIYSSTTNPNLAIVSSDDDFWPGIKTTIVNGGRIIHIHTRARSTPTFYVNTTPAINYIQKQL